MYKMSSEEKLSQTEQKKQNIGIKSFYSNKSYGFEYKQVQLQWTPSI